MAETLYRSGTLTLPSATQPRYVVPRLVTGLVGCALVLYGWRRKRGIVSRLASAAGFSLIAHGLGRESSSKMAPLRRLLA